MKVLCIGDSNTYGFDPRSYIGERYPETVHWTDRVQSHELINWGINGITVPQDPAVYIDLIRRKEPDLVIVMLGTNDIIQGLSAVETSRHMGAFIDSLNTASKPILLIAPPPFRIGEAVQSEDLKKESEKLGDLYRSIAEKKGCRYADAGKWDIELTFDGVRFSPAGHERFADRFE